MLDCITLIIFTVVSNSNNLKQKKMNEKTKNGNAQQQKESPKSEAIIKELQADPITERKLKVVELQKKVHQIEKLNAVLRELSEFIEGTDEEGYQHIEIRDNNRKTFETKNPVIVGKVINCIINECKNKIPVLEQELITATF